MSNACPRCKGKGFVESFYLADNANHSTIAQCLLCKQVDKYSEEVKRRVKGHQPPEKTGDVLPFRRKDG